jgi:hypothetical protein
LGVPESDLIPLMDELGERFPDLKLFSLPHIGADPHILLGVRGRCGLETAMEALRAGLVAAAMAFREHSPG